MANRELTDYRKIDEIFAHVLELSPADETELVWLERRYGQVSSRPTEPAYLEPPRCTVLVRVVVKGRVGWHRMERGEIGQVEIALRQAMALATTQKTARRLPVLPMPGDDIVVQPSLFDPRVADLDVETARRQAQALCTGQDEEAVVHWSQIQLAVVNSHGLCRQGEATEVSLTFRSGEGPFAGRAAASARSLRELDAPTIVARARSRRTALPLGALPQGPMPLFLSAEATAELLNVVNIFALGGRAYLDGASVLAKHRNVQVFDQRFHLRDDPEAQPGLRFPFDFEGSAKKALDLVVGGRPILPALSQHQGGEAGLESTAQSVGGRDAFFGNLFLLPGELDEAALIEEAKGGVFAAWIDRPECYEPSQLRIRAVLRGVRAVKDGRLAEPLPDLCWDDGLLHAFGRLRGIGRATVVRAMPSTPFGAIGAPPLVLADAADLRPLAEPTADDKGRGPHKTARRSPRHSSSVELPSPGFSTQSLATREIGSAETKSEESDTGSSPDAAGLHRELGQDLVGDTLKFTADASGYFPEPSSTDLSRPDLTNPDLAHGSGEEPSGEEPRGEIDGNDAPRG